MANRIEMYPGGSEQLIVYVQGDGRISSIIAKDRKTGFARLLFEASKVSNETKTFNVDALAYALAREVASRLDRPVEWRQMTRESRNLFRDRARTAMAYMDDLSTSDAVDLVTAAQLDGVTS